MLPDWPAWEAWWRPVAIGGVVGLLYAVVSSITRRLRSLEDRVEALEQRPPGSR
jgi:hypothetical protein